MATFTQPQSVITQQVTVIKSPEWSTGICDCCDDMGVCCCATWCLPCFMCKTASDFGQCVCLPLLDPMLTGYFLGFTPVTIPPISLAMRASMRERFGIQGTICDDCCTVFCCYSCSWCQMARELKKRKQPLTIVNAQTTTFNVAQPSDQPTYNPIY
ncbi:cornifelin homolog [Erpetoichthys calabaricus]|uniref:Cornifelin homolog n=1 Tax=Erpetoichthys calabaricus TaxID=27687 RepID=A0A8C4X9W7_ERPCA|nr:cornifelin homolog [Erpetoichthys calabaricus]